MKITAMGSLFPLNRLRSIKAGNGGNKPLLISTWNFGLEANKTGWEILKRDGSALDAAEATARVPEADPDNHSVGFGGYPDRDGHVTLDACIMKGDGQCGSVAFLEKIMHPVSVARKVMEVTPHIMLTGDGALQFALNSGFQETELLTDKAREEWENWKIKSEYNPIPNIENHDTIGVLAIDHRGDLAGACTTSGLAFKMRGRVGDSPLIGPGLFVDQEVGGATATGNGEEIIRVAGSHTVVEMMRQGRTPVEACKEAVMRIIRKNDDLTNLQCAFIALNKEGEYGAYAIRKGFSYAVSGFDGNQLTESDYEL